MITEITNVMELEGNWLTLLEEKISRQKYVEEKVGELIQKV